MNYSQRSICILFTLFECVLFYFPTLCMVLNVVKNAGMVPGPYIHEDVFCYVSRMRMALKMLVYIRFCETENKSKNL